MLLGVGTFAKPTNVLLIAPLLVSALMRSQWHRTVKIGATFGFVVVALFALNTAVTGEWNYQGGERKTFYSGGGVDFKGGFPFQDDAKTFDSVGLARVGGGSFSVLFTRDTLLEVFRRNVAYFVVGRHTGFAIYLFPGLMAILMFLAATRDRAMWQWLTLGAGVGTAVALLLYMPFTWSGGGGPVGNRYFLGTYGVFLFLVPPLQTAVGGLLTLAISGLFVMRIVANPFYASTHPSEHSKSGIFRRLPIELTMVNDLPINLQPDRTRQPLGGTPPIFAYFIDDNIYNREGDAFWVKGESTADLLLRAPISPETKAAGVEEARSLRLEKLTVIFEVEMPRGVPYKYHPDYPTNYVYSLSISSSTGFVPMFESGLPDSRFLGVMVRLIPTYGAAQ